MTLDETIKEFTDWAKDNRKEQNYWAAERNESYDETNPLSYADCEGFERDAEERAEYHEQLAEWLTELKERRAADVQPVKHGYWEEVIDYGGWGDTHYRCSVCGEEWYLEDGKPKDNNMNFCPRCGARMDLGDEKT